MTPEQPKDEFTFARRRAHEAVLDAAPSQGSAAQLIASLRCQPYTEARVNHGSTLLEVPHAYCAQRFPGMLRGVPVTAIV